MDFGSLLVELEKRCNPKVVRLIPWMIVIILLSWVVQAIDTLLISLAGVNLRESIDLIVANWEHLPERLKLYLKLPLVSIISLGIATMILIFAEFLTTVLLGNSYRTALRTILEASRLSDEAEKKMEKANVLMKKAKQKMRKAMREEARR